MEMPITQAMARLDELLRLVEAGATAVLTRHGKAAADWSRIKEARRIKVAGHCQFRSS
jgi:antitoxin (DNA-binding transcriptional repressor) of toxin-antitoxin stability system